MPLTLVTGATGFVGNALVKHLPGPLRVATRQPMTWPGVETVAVGEITGGTDWRFALNGVETVVHCAALTNGSEAALITTNDQGTRSLAMACVAAGVKRLVFMSSALVNGPESGDTPFSPSSHHNPASAYARSKLRAEIALKEIEAASSLEVVIIRPPIVTGPGAKGNLALIAKLARKGIPLLLGDLTRNRRDVVSLFNLNSLVEVCLTHPDAPGRTFMVSDGKPLSTRQIADRVLADEGLNGWFVTVPAGVLAAGFRALGKGAMVSQLLGNLEVDLTETRHVLGWSPCS